MNETAIETCTSDPGAAASPADAAFRAALAVGRPGPAWLTERRAAGAVAFAAAGLPTTRREDWKYTSIRNLQRRSFRDVVPASLPDEARLASVLIPELPLPRLVFMNGRLLPGLSHVESPGLDILTMRETPADAGFVDLLGRLATVGDYPFAALNQGLAEEVVLLRTARGTTGLAPVYLLFLSSPSAEPVAGHPRILIDAGEASALTVLEHYASLGANENLTNAVTELCMAPGANVTHCRLQDESYTSFHIGGLFAHLQRDASLVSHNIQSGAALARLDLRVSLAAPGAEVELNGLYTMNGRRHVDNHTRVDHLAPHTRSTQDYRGMLDDKSRGVFSGKAVVHPDAQKIEAHQSNNNLLLSDTAEADTKPELEIYADDVKCSHGATVGQLDAEALFYLRSRGIGPEVARALLTFAFAETVISRIDIGGVRERLESDIAGSLPEGGLLRDYLRSPRPDLKDA